MSVQASRDFAAMLDELLAEHAAETGRDMRQSVDHLSVVEELHSGRIRIAERVAEAEYRDASGAEPAGEPSNDTPPPSIDPDVIAGELGLRGLRAHLPKNYDRLRRDFAFRNHPDRVAEHLRAYAIVRMQIANTLIDEAKRGRARRKRF